MENTKNPDFIAILKRHMKAHKEGVPFKYRGSLCFDHLFLYTRGFKKPSDMAHEYKIETTALWLCSYLAHWGMFRGSSNLKETNLDFFKFLVSELLRAEDGILNPIAHLQFHEMHSVEVQVLDRVFSRMTDCLKSGGVSATDTLRSKIILGLTHNVPGYDRFFRDGLKRLDFEYGVSMGCALNGKNVIELSGWYQETALPAVKADGSDHLLPSGRMVDMILNQYGREWKNKP